MEEAGKTRRTPGGTGERMESRRRDDDRWQKTEREKKEKERRGKKREKEDRREQGWDVEGSEGEKEFEGGKGKLKEEDIEGVGK